MAGGPATGQAPQASQPAAAVSVRRTQQRQAAGLQPIVERVRAGLAHHLAARAPGRGPTSGGRSAVFLYPEDDLAIVVLANLMGANPDTFMNELAGFYLPDMKATTGFGLSPTIRALHT